MSPTGPAFEQTLRDVDSVEGWMTPGQAELLWLAAARVPANGTIVEIGSFRGRSTIVLARSADPAVNVVAIDPHAGNDRGPQEIEGFGDAAEVDNQVFNDNLRSAGVHGQIQHVRKFSDAAHTDVTGSVDLLYVDGAHRFKPARADIASWGDRVNDGGTMLIHDSFSSVGVTLALLSELFFGGAWRYVGRSESLTEYRRESLSGLKRVANAQRQARELPWFIRNLLIKFLILAKQPSLVRRLGHDPKVWPY